MVGPAQDVARALVRVIEALGVIEARLTRERRRTGRLACTVGRFCV
jgi:hypothetical protein